MNGVNFVPVTFWNSDEQGKGAIATLPFPSYPSYHPGDVISLAFPVQKENFNDSGYYKIVNVIHMAGVWDNGESHVSLNVWVERLKDNG